MKTILDSFEEECGAFDLAEDKSLWTRKLAIYQKGWAAGVAWEIELIKKKQLTDNLDNILKLLDIDSETYDTLHGEKDEDND